jgi:replicative DNA helicase
MLGLEHTTTPESEYALLGAAMVGPAGLTALLGLDEGDLNGAHHRTVYRAIRDLAAGGEPVTPQTVATKLRVIGQLEDIGGLPSLVNLVESCDSGGASRWHAAKIRETATLRNVVGVAHMIIQQAQEAPADPEKVTAYAVEKLLNTSGRDLEELTVSPAAAVQAMKDQADRERAGTALSWGLTPLDEAVQLLPGSLTYVAARPKVGKSSLGFQLAARNARQCRVAVGSYEMGRDQLTQHLMGKFGYRTGLTMRDAKYGPYDDPRWVQAHESVCRLDLAMLFHQPDMPTLAAQLNALHRVRPFSLIVVDYVGKVAQASAVASGKMSDNFQMAVAMVSGHLKRLAMELECAVVSMAQINRAGADEPELHHLRDSGALEADADAVVLLHRPRPDEDAEGRAVPVDEVLVKVAANRMGPASDWMPLAYEGRYGLFRDPGRPLAIVGA